MTWLWWLSTIFSLYVRRVTGTAHIPDRPFIIAANHEGPMDPLFLLCALRRPIFFLATHTLISNRNTNLWWWHKWWVFMVGQAIATGPGAIDRCVSALQSHKTLCIFPEGRIHPESPDQRIHGGLAVIAHKSQAPILPVHIIGSGAVWPITNSPINILKFNSVEVRIGEAIPPPSPAENLSLENYRTISADIMQKISAI